MKTILHSIAFGLLLSAGLESASAQIRNNESSVAALAIQCAVSSGYSASDYEEYCRSLAKTIGMLSSAQQTRVFGYLPMPGGGSSETEAAVESTPVTTTAPIQTAAATTSSPVTATTVSKTDSPVDSSPTTATTTNAATGSGNTVGNTNTTNQDNPASNGAKNSLLDFLLQLLQGTKSSLTTNR